MGARFATIIILICIAVLLPSCGGKINTPLYMDAQLKASEIDKIFILPTVDNRVDKNYEIDAEYWPERWRGGLEEKGYAAYLSPDFGGVDTISDADLEIIQRQPEWVRELGPPESRWLFLPVLTRFEETGGALCFEWRVSVQGYLMDKQTGRVRWKGRGEEQQSATCGLIGLLSSGGIRGSTKHYAVEDLLEALPDKGHL